MKRMLALDLYNVLFDHVIMYIIMIFILRLPKDRKKVKLQY